MYDTHLGPTGTPYAIGGTVSGLAAFNTAYIKLTLPNNSDGLQVASNGPFQFNLLAITGSVYSVTVEYQPRGQNCSVTNGTGTVDNANVTNIVVTCS